MSVNLDNIDLNSDVVSGEPDNDVNVVNNLSGTKSKLGLSSYAETLMHSANRQGPRQELVVHVVEDFQGDNDSKEGFGRRTDSAHRSADLEGEAGSVSEVDDASMREVAQTTEALSSKVEGEENGSCKIEEEVKEGTCGVVISSSAESPVKIDGMGVGLESENDSLPRKEPENVPKGVTSDGVNNPLMEINEQANNSDGRIEAADACNERVLPENENLESHELNLIVDLEPYVGAFRDAAGSENVKTASQEAGISVGDLAWAKVRSHPWWPGQIFGRSDASKKAKKYFKKESYLIAYFGDQTFAWNEVSKIKPFRSNYSLMEKQSHAEDFHDAIRCALDEVSRRVEFGLACPCIPEYGNIKTQIVVNAGIREESCRRDGGDSFSSATCFEPAKLIGYVKALGQLQFEGIDKLHFVTAQSQLLAFNRWKGYSYLPKFQILGNLLETDAEIPQSTEVKHDSEMVECASTKVKDDKPLSTGEEHPKSQGHSTHKRKHDSGDSGHPCKKEKSLADMMAKRRSSAAKGRAGFAGEGTGKIAASSSDKKRKAVDPVSDHTMVKPSKSPLSSEVDSCTSQPKRTFRVGDSILRVASQLNGSTPILKSVMETSLNTKVKSKSHETSLSRKYKASSDELVSQICLVAKDPMKACSFPKSVVSFLVEFRNSVCIDQVDSERHVKATPEHIYGGDVGEVSTRPETETSDSGHMKDCCWTDKMSLGSPEDGPSLANRNEAGGFFPVEASTKEGEKQSEVQMGPGQEVAGGNHNFEAGKPIYDLEGKHNDDSSSRPSALILNFTDLNAVPSETNLTRIFSHFGPLKESETQVLKKSKRAKVVFHRSADAEAAFSSAGKYSIFGPSLVSYRLKYINPTKCRSSSSAKKMD